LLEEGHDVEMVGCESGVEYRGKQGTSVTSTAAASDIDLEAIDAVVVPGGYSPTTCADACR
jgi:protease I